MQAYFGDAISARLSRTPEGFLVAQQARLCRSGWQTYHPSELKLGGSEMIEVYRPRSEVLADSFLASLEGKCVVDEHPRNDWVNSQNARWFCCGHCSNIRKGPDLENGDATVIGDLVITDESLINKIASGKRELSVGYEYRMLPRDDGSYEMRDLVANHIALVEHARAGEQIRILDHALEAPEVTCSCPRELARLVPPDEVREIDFGAATRRFLGRNIMEVRNR
jgi:uncharacterized protein